ncbi:unnamed protein product [Clonostachys rosea f. rosea IK726]|uniref:Uncharacterized protein n=1 Tax=Clonostachys rosea f. rosea IK726 TaxID=1349383 RepID=A0ACA9UH18_BIOOC|nr:unnamed protein product [Clonostachys rosea f. rosea IK726]
MKSDIKFLDPKAPVAIKVQAAIKQGDPDTLQELLDGQPGLATIRIGDATEARSLLHIATDWPGHIPNGPKIIKILVDAGGDVNATFVGKHTETPLHWAASNDDVLALDVLLDLGANIEAEGGVICDGTPLADARAFLQLSTATRLVERGAHVDLQDAATLGLMDHLEKEFVAQPGPQQETINMAFWNACHGGQILAAKFLHQHGADMNYIPPWADNTPLAEAKSVGYDGLVSWLNSIEAQA